jgi:hypothetical protein
LAAVLLSSDLGLILEMGWDAQMKFVIERLAKIVLFDQLCTGWSQRKGISLPGFSTRWSSTAASSEHSAICLC